MHTKFSPPIQIWRQRGRTLIELLVAIGLGLLILLGVGALFLGANQSSRVARNVASTEETGQMVLAAIGNAIRRAGYAEVVGGGDTASRQDLLYSGPLVQGCVGTEFTLTAGKPKLTGNNYDCGTTTTGKPDSLYVAFQANNVVASPQGEFLDCLGQQAPEVDIANADYRGMVASGKVRVVENIYYLNGTNLMCLGSGNPTAPQALMSNVEEFKVYYGFDDDALGRVLANDFGSRLPAVQTIRDADFIRGVALISPNYSPWDFVVTVHVCVLVASEEAGVRAQADGATPKHRPCPSTAAEAADPTSIAEKDSGADGRVRRTFMQVFTLRSRAAATPAELS